MLFIVNEHILPCQHLREYANATATTEEAVLHLAIKEYIPRDNLNPTPGDVTIISAHANGFCKVCLNERNMKIQIIADDEFCCEGVV